MALLPQVVDAVEVPVVAAGGIADGRGLAAALALGAQGAQLGTRFLLATESGVFSDYRLRISAARDADTIITTALSGRPARGLPNRIIREIEALGSPSFGWPKQAATIGDVRGAAESADNGELTSLWCGQAAGLATEALSAAAIVRAIMEEAALWSQRGADLLRG
jgi:nitronate monooxygenase